MSYAVFVCLIAGFVSVLIVKRWRRSVPANASVAGNSRLLGEAAWLMSPAIVAMTFAGFSEIDLTPPGWVKKPNPKTILTNTASTHGTASNIVPQGSRVTPPGTTMTAERSDGLSQRPAWVDQSRKSDGTSELIVLASQQYSTREEAEQALSAETLKLVSSDLQQLYPGQPRSSWKPTEDQIQKIAVKQKYVEVVDRDFGKFSHPMYRVWWQVELSPEVRTEFLPAWRQSLTTVRVRQVGIVVSTLVLVASLIAACCRLDVLTRGTSRRRLGALASGTALVWLAAILFIAERWL